MYAPGQCVDCIGPLQLSFHRIPLFGQYDSPQRVDFWNQDAWRITATLTLNILFCVSSLVSVAARPCNEA